MTDQKNNPPARDLRSVEEFLVAESLEGRRHPVPAVIVARDAGLGLAEAYTALAALTARRQVNTRPEETPKYPDLPSRLLYKLAPLRQEPELPPSPFPIFRGPQTIFAEKVRKLLRKHQDPMPDTAIAEESGFSLETVQKALADLVAGGHVTARPETLPEGSEDQARLFYRLTPIFKAKAKAKKRPSPKKHLRAASYRRILPAHMSPQERDVLRTLDPSRPADHFDIRQTLTEQGDYKPGDPISTALADLERRGFITRQDAPQYPGAKGRPRGLYTLTKAGKEERRMQQTARARGATATQPQN